MRLIYADDLKVRLMDSYDPYHKGGTEIEIDTVIGMIDEAPTIKEWISVKEKLPKDEQLVAALLYGLVGYNTILLQYNAFLKEFITDDGIEFDIDDVAYWVGLPEPPEEKKGEDE